MKFYQNKEVVLRFILFYFIFQLGDMVTTKYGMIAGLIEANQIFATLFDAGFWQFAMLVKLTIAVLFVALFLEWRKRLNKVKYTVMFICYFISSLTVLNNSIALIRIVSNT